MEQINITLTFDSRRLEALEFFLRKERTSVQKRMEEALRRLYEQTVPDVMREFLDKGQPSKPKRPPGPGQPKTAAASGATPKSEEG